MENSHLSRLYEASPGLRLTQAFGIVVVASTALCALLASEAVQAWTLSGCVAHRRHTALRAAIAWHTIWVVVEAGQTLVASRSAVALFAQAFAAVFVTDLRQRALQIAITI